MEESKSNNDLTLNLAGASVPRSDWQYYVSTAFEECAVDPWGEEPGTCIRCRGKVQLGSMCQHPVFYRHILRARIPDRFPVNPKGQKAVPRLWPVRIQRGVKLLLDRRMQTKVIEMPQRSLLVHLVLEWCEPIKYEEKQPQTAASR